MTLTPKRIFCSEWVPSEWEFKLVIDRYLVFITDNDYLHVYVPDNRYSEPIFIYCYKVNK